MVAAETIYEVLSQDEECFAGVNYEISADEEVKEITNYQDAMENSWVYEELKAVRNCHAAFHYGFLP